MRKEIKNSLLGLTACFGLIFLASCEEQKPPGLDLGGSLAADSSYSASVEAKQDRVVVIEELTGVDCANCPDAATIIKTISTSNPGRILSTGIFPPAGGAFTEPLFGKSKYDFRTPKADEITVLLGGIPSLPAASLNRIKKSNNQFFDVDRGAWAGRIAPWLAQSTPVNIHLESSYTPDNNTGELIAKIAFTEDVADDVYLTAYIIENDIEDYQNVAGDKRLYMHQHVFRDAITSISGTSLNFKDKNAGTVLQKRIKFSPTIEGDNAWNLDNCRILAFVHKSGADQAILHGAEIHLK